jgi:hypothetical protein
VRRFLRAALPFPVHIIDYTAIAAWLGFTPAATVDGTDHAVGLSIGVAVFSGCLNPI